MKTLKLNREFSHCDGVYPETYEPGEYLIVEGAGDPKEGTISQRGAEVALQNGYRKALARKPKGKAAPASDGSDGDGSNPTQ